MTMMTSLIATVVSLALLSACASSVTASAPTASVAPSAPKKPIFLSHDVVNDKQNKNLLSFPVASSLSPSSALPTLHLLQLSHHEHKAAVEASLNVSLFAYIPQDTWLVHAPTKHLVANLGEHHSHVASFLTHFSPKMKTRGAIPNDARELYVFLAPNTDLAPNLKWRVAQNVGQDAVHIVVEAHVTTAAVVDALLALDHVYFVDRVLEAKLFNGWARQTVLGGVSDAVMPSGMSEYYDAGIDGAGEVIGVMDSGLDYNHAFFRDPHHVTIPFNLAISAHRKIARYAYESGKGDNLAAGYDDHGTHVVGSILGNTIEGSHSHRGIAPNAKVSFFDVGGTGSGLLVNIEKAFTNAQTDGAFIHSNSWGFGAPSQYLTSAANQYSSSSRLVDTLTHTNPEFLFLFAAGNDGEHMAKGTVSNPATGKNVLTVGASANGATAAMTAMDAAWAARDGFQSSDSLASFSSRGPTYDARIKPDVIAPGHHIHSSRSDPSSAETGAILQMSGTSMATPVTAGTVALLRQWLIVQRQVVSPTAALLKALIINGADLVPQEQVTDSPIAGVDSPTYMKGISAIGSSLPLGAVVDIATSTRLSVAIPYTVSSVWLQIVTAQGHCSAYIGTSSSVSSTNYYTESVTGEETYKEIFLNTSVGLSSTLYVYVSVATGFVPPSRCKIAVNAMKPANTHFHSKPKPITATCITTLDSLPFMSITPRIISPSGSIIPLTISCPSDCRSSQEAVWGTGTYRSDSSICRAAIHGGVIDGAGTFTLVYSSATKSFTGSVNNRVSSQSYESSSQLSTFVVRRGFAVMESVDTSRIFTDGQGFGRINLAQSAPLKTSAVDVHILAEDHRFVAEGDSFSKCVFVAQPDELVHVTMAYSDHPGSILSTRSLVNNLNLKVTASNGDVLMLGNGHAVPDEANNVEKVKVRVGEPSTLCATVTATSLHTSQSFSLVLRAKKGVVSLSGSADSQKTSPVVIGLAVSGSIVVLVLLVALFVFLRKRGSFSSSYFPSSIELEEEQDEGQDEERREQQVMEQQSPMSPTDVDGIIIR